MNKSCNQYVTTNMLQNLICYNYYVTINILRLICYKICNNSYVITRIVIDVYDESSEFEWVVWGRMEEEFKEGVEWIRQNLNFDRAGV